MRKVVKCFAAYESESGRTSKSFPSATKTSPIIGVDPTDNSSGIDLIQFAAMNLILIEMEFPFQNLGPQTDYPSTAP
jgi:hypothetical protein